MSVEHLKAFFAKLESDVGLQDKARALHGRSHEERVDGLCALAADEGLDVTPEDWKHESVEPAAAALEDTTLRQVVGGAACVSPGLTVQPQGNQAMPGL